MGICNHFRAERSGTNKNLRYDVSYLLFLIKIPEISDGYRDKYFCIFQFLMLLPRFLF